MTHELHACGHSLPQSQLAIDLLHAAMALATGTGGCNFESYARTEIDALCGGRSGAGMPKATVVQERALNR